MTRKIIQEIISVILRVAFVVALVVIGFKGTTYCYEFGYKIFADEAKDPSPGITKTVAIVDGKSDKEIGEILKDKGLIDNSLLFVFQVKFSEYDGKLKPGVYELTTAMTPYEIIAVMAQVDLDAIDNPEDETDIVSKDQATLWDEADDVSNPANDALDIPVEE